MIQCPDLEIRYEEMLKNVSSIHQKVPSIHWFAYIFYLPVTFPIDVRIILPGFINNCSDTPKLFFIMSRPIMVIVEQGGERFDLSLRYSPVR